jgi:hypothetical protein
MKKEIKIWLIVLIWITIMSIWLRGSIVSEAEKDRKVEIAKMCLSQQLNGDFAWKINGCQKIILELD